MITTSHLYNSLATGGILFAIDYFAYKELFDVKILGTSAAADYFASNISEMLLDAIKSAISDVILLDNVSSGLIYAGLNYFLKYDQRSLLITFLIQFSSSYAADIVLMKYGQ
jgi:hypothetical protein